MSNLKKYTLWILGNAFCTLPSEKNPWVNKKIAHLALLILHRKVLKTNILEKRSCNDLSKKVTSESVDRILK